MLRMIPSSCLLKELSRREDVRLQEELTKPKEVLAKVSGTVVSVDDCDFLGLPGHQIMLQIDIDDMRAIGLKPHQRTIHHSYFLTRIGNFFKEGDRVMVNIYDFVSNGQIVWPPISYEVEPFKN